MNGTHLRVLSVLDADNKVTYVEYLENINSELNYDVAPKPSMRLINEKRSATSFPLL